MDILERALDAQPKARRAYITIEPHFDPSVFNLGLEKYGRVLFEGAKQIEDLGSITVAGVERYKTGLDEYAPDVKLLPKEEREAKVKQIRETVARLELELAQNVVDPEDKDFWSKVQLLSSTNREFWSKVNLTVGSEPVALDPENPQDLIRIFAIEAGGFNLVAPSLEAAKTSNKSFKFYLSRLEDTSAIRTEIKKLRNKAGGELDKLRNSKQNKLFLVAKVFLQPENGFTRSTPIDVLYDKIDDKLDGVLIGRNERDRKKADIAQFLAITQADNQTLLMSAYVKDAIFYRILVQRSDKQYQTPTGVACGNKIAEVVEFYKNPLNEKELEELIERVEKRWI